jgi:Rv2525c-like, glycoside hydrolase-like domain
MTKKGPAKRSAKKPRQRSRARASKGITTKERAAKRARKSTGTRGAGSKPSRVAVAKRRPGVRARRRAAPPLVARIAGFDCGSYPGDAAINTWAAKSPYSFVGFYFDAPCHTPTTFKSWSGKLPVIKAAGLGIIVIYVGFQQDGCGKTKLSRAKGLTHGQDTVTKFAAEKFPDKTIVFLDIEHYNGVLSPAMEAYIRGWISTVLDNPDIGIGIYCPASKANEIRLAAEKEYAAHGLPGGAPTFWIVKSDVLFDPATSKPTDCGVAFAKVWQGRLDVAETHGGTTITIDQNVADRRDPSGAMA